MKEDTQLQFNVDLNTFSGPLDILLDLAKSQKVNLENISITKLADQFHDFITKTLDLNLELASEYLLMATWLAYLKSKLLLPETDEEEFKALEVAEKLKLQLKKLVPVHKVADFKREDKNVIFKEMALFKLVGTNGKIEKAITACKKYNAVILDSTNRSKVVQITALRREIDKMANDLKKYGLISISRTGAVAMTRGEKVFK